MWEGKEEEEEESKKGNEINGCKNLPPFARKFYLKSGIFPRILNFHLFEKFLQEDFSSAFLRFGKAKIFQRVEQIEIN